MPVKLKGSSAGEMDTKGPLPPRPDVLLKMSVSKIAVEERWLGLASADQFQCLQPYQHHPESYPTGPGSIRLSATIPTNLPQSSLVLGNKIPMPKRKMTHPMDRGCLVVVHGVEVIVAVQSVREAGDGRDVLEAEDGGDVGLLLGRSQRTPSMFRQRSMRTSGVFPIPAARTIPSSQAERCSARTRRSFGRGLQG
jgi:hypothetical protein